MADMFKMKAEKKKKKVEVKFEQVELYSGNFNFFILNVDSSHVEHAYIKSITHSGSERFYLSPETHNI